MDTAPFTLEITQDAPAVFHAPSCSPSLTVALVRRYNRWRRGDESLEMERPKVIGETLDAICNHAEKLERELSKAITAIEAIEERYIDGCDTYEDWKFMGQSAREYLFPTNDDVLPLAAKDQSNEKQN